MLNYIILSEYYSSPNSSNIAFKIPLLLRKENIKENILRNEDMRLLINLDQTFFTAFLTKIDKMFIINTTSGSNVDTQKPRFSPHKIEHIHVFTLLTCFFWSLLFN